jgi:hypothetical protein
MRYEREFTRGCERRVSRAAERRRSEGRRLSFPSDDDVGGYERDARAAS